MMQKGNAPFTSQFFNIFEKKQRMKRIITVCMVWLLMGVYAIAQNKPYQRGQTPLVSFSGGGVTAVSDGADYAFVRCATLYRGRARCKVNGNIGYTFNALDCVLHVCAAVVAHHAIHLEFSLIHSCLLFYCKSLDECVNQQQPQSNAANNLEQGRLLMAAGMTLHDTLRKPLRRQQIVNNKAESYSSQCYGEQIYPHGLAAHYLTYHQH